jgi:hypothetical protein
MPPKKRAKTSKAADTQMCNRSEKEKHILTIVGETVCANVTDSITDTSDFTSKEKKEMKTDRERFDKDSIKELKICNATPEDIDEACEALSREWERGLVAGIATLKQGISSRKNKK